MAAVIAAVVGHELDASGARRGDDEDEDEEEINVVAPSLKCRPSWHGWGLDKLDSTRLKFSQGSPGGAF